ncbi:hypothetical protein BH11MYX1_BH11MYX1_12120 [soil metagenome]
MVTWLPERVPVRAVLVAVFVVVAVLAGRASAAPPARVPVVPIMPPAECEGEACGEDAAFEEASERAAPDFEMTPGVIAGPRAASRCGGCLAMPLAVSEVARAAVRAAGLSEDPTPGWRYRARLAGLVPIVSARFGHNSSWKEVDDPTLANSNTFDVRATWQLERLMFDQNEIRIEAIDVSRRREKRKVEELAIHSYYAWLAAQQFAPRSASWQTRADELAADLDALTDAWFTLALKRGKP